MKQTYSVLMSVYYKEKPEYLETAIKSMLDQTVRTNDFVLVCDGPLTPELDDVIDIFFKSHPGLFNVIRLPQNQGLGNALNIGLEYCKNDLVARMDSDDISLLDRCEVQLKMFEKNPGLAFCSGAIAEFMEDPSQIIAYRKLPLSDTAIHKFAKRRNPINHMAVMYKKSAVKAAGSYIEIHGAEDYYLWARMLTKGCEAANTEKILVYARVGNGMYERRGGSSYIKSIILLQKRLLDSGFINKWEFLQNCAIRYFVSIVPDEKRKKIYLLVLRKNDAKV